MDFLLTIKSKFQKEISQYPKRLCKTPKAYSIWDRHCKHWKTPPCIESNENDNGGNNGLRQCRSNPALPMLQGITFPLLGVSMTVSRPCINIWGKYTVYHFSSHLNCIMISMQTQVNRGQGTKLNGSWKQLQWFLSLTMLGWLSYQKPLVHAS